MSLYSALTQVLAPFAAKIKGIQTGYDGTEYTSPGEAVREQINDLHVMIGDVPGAAIQASAVAYNNSNVAAELTAVNGRLGDIKSAISDCEDGTGILRERGYFPDGYKAISDKRVGTRYYNFDLSQDTFEMDFDATGTGAMTVGVKLDDSGIALSDSIVRIADYPVVKIHTDTNVPSDANLHFRISTYQSNGSTVQHSFDVAIPQGESDHTIDVAQKIADMHWSGDVYYRIRNIIADDSYAYSIVPYVHSTHYGFLTITQAERYTLVQKYADIITRLDSAEEVTEKAVTAIGEVNLIDNTKMEPGLLDGSGVVTNPGVTNQQITTDFIPVENGVEYILQTWASQTAISDQLVRIVSFDSLKSFVARSDIRTNQTIKDGYLYNALPLTYDSGVAYIRISLNTFGDWKMKMERADTITDWTPGLGAIENTPAWNDVITHPIYGIIHRGCGENQTAPENTIPGFIWGKKNGFDFCETDIRYTSDGVAVLLHDASINRTARNADGTEISGTVNIADITYAQALTYDFGIYKGTEYAGTKVPTLEEFIVLCKNIGLHPVLELKAFKNAESDISAIFDMLKAYRMTNHVSWLASNYAWLAIIKNHDVGAHLCLLTSDTSANRNMMILSMLKTPSNEVTLTILTDFITTDLIAEMKSRGISCNAYCPNNETAMLALDEFVTAVTSDRLNYETVRKNSILGG